MSSRGIFQSHRVTLGFLLLLSVLGTSLALADNASDPPGRAARLSYANGSVSMQPAGVEDWADATINRPLTTGDKLWTDQNSRAEIDIGVAVIRMGSTTGFSFLNLDDRTAQMNITAGTVIVHVRDGGTQGQALEVDTPNVAVGLESPGDYRVEVNDAGDTTVVKVSDGDAEVSASGQTVPLHTQQAYVFNGTNQVSAAATSVGAPDELDSWSIDRDHRSESAQERTSQFVSPDMTGADDLAEYGSWQDTSDYGPVWTPTVVAAGWSPYHFGRWVWVAPWGWTWVDDAPWGFAPFHYGRWAYLGTQWCWVPGPRTVRPIYAPALVAWVGSPGASFSFAVGGGGGVAWFPLGPREVFVPAYHVSPAYVQNVNVTNTRIINTTYITNVYENRVTNINYVNRDRPGAVVAVSRDVFTSARPISGHTVRVPERDLARFGARGAAPAIAPVRESVLASRPDVSVRRPPATLMNRPVVARTSPPPPPVPFARQQQAIQANGGRPLARSELTSLQQGATTNPRVRVVAPGPVRPVEQGRGQQFNAGGNQRSGTGGQQFGTVPQAPTQSMSDRERALHGTPASPPQGNQNGYRNDRPSGAAPSRATPYERSEGSPTFRNDRPPGSQSRSVPQARPFEQPRQEYQSPRQEYQPPRQEYQRQESQPPRQEYQAPRQEHQPPRQEYQAPRQEHQPPRQEYQPPPRQEYQPPRQEYQPPPRQEARQEAPRAAPPPQQHQSPPPQQRNEDHRGRPGEPPHVNRQ